MGSVSLHLSRGRWRAEMPNRPCNTSPDPRDGGSRHLIPPVSVALFAVSAHPAAPFFGVCFLALPEYLTMPLDPMDMCSAGGTANGGVGSGGDSLRHAGRTPSYRAYRVLRAPPPSTKMEAWERLFPAVFSRLASFFSFAQLYIFYAPHK